MVLYYIDFGVDIIYFITLSDLLNAALEGIIRAFLFYFPLIIISLVAINRKKLKQKLPKSISELIKQQPLFYILFIILSALIVFIMLEDAISYAFYDSWTAVIVTLLFIASILAPLAINKAKILLGYQPLNLVNQLTVFLAIFPVLFYVLDAYKDSSLVTEYQYFNDTTIHFKDGTKITSDSSQYYIGNTSQYLFFYHGVPNSYTSVYPMSEIKQIDIK